MKIVNLTTFPFENNRSELRKQIINIFLDEVPGTGKGEDCSKYEYIIYDNKINIVYLKRPAQFNNGFDFTIHVSNINFNPEGRSTTRPTHANILEDLGEKKQENTQMYDILISQIENIFNCLPYNLTGIFFNSGLSIDILCETIKWLFVEQDVTYWNYSGRAMFYNAIQEM